MTDSLIRKIYIDMDGQRLKTPKNLIFDYNITHYLINNV